MLLPQQQNNWNLAVTSLCEQDDNDNVDIIGDVDYPYFKEDSACLMGLGSVRKYLSDPWKLPKAQRTQESSI